MNYDFLILGFGESGGAWTNPQWMAYTLANKGYQVAYINPPAYRKINLNDSSRIIERIFSRKGPKNDINFDVYNCYANLHFPFNLLNKFEENRIDLLIKKSKNIICCQPLWLKFSNPHYHNTTFLICDDYSSLKNASPTQSKYDKLIENSYDKIVITNESLKSKYPNSTFLPNCISDIHFNESSEDLRRLKVKNQVCFVGTLHSEKIDLDLIFTTVESNPSFNFIFAGKLFGLKESDLPKLSNFIYLGELSFLEASHLMKTSEYGLIPFIQNKYTRHVFSMKYFEYIASLVVPICSKIPMYKSLPIELRPNTYLDYNQNIPSFNISDLNSIRNIVLEDYTYKSRISKMFELNYIQ